MSNRDVITIAIRNLVKRKLRSFLTIFGVIIGTTSIVIMLSLGVAMSKSFNEQMAMMGDVTDITIYNQQGGGNGGGGGNSPNSGEAKLNDSALASFDKIEGVKAVIPSYNVNMPVYSGKLTNYANIDGIDMKYAKEYGLDLETGTLPSEEDKMGIVFGSEFAYNFYNPNVNNNNVQMNNGEMNNGGDSVERPKPKVDVMKDKMVFTFDYNYGNNNVFDNEATDVAKTKPYKMKALGVLKAGSYNTGYMCYMNINDVKKMKLDQMKANGGDSKKRAVIDQYDKVIVKTSDIKFVKTVSEKLKNMGYQVDSPLEYTEQFQKSAEGIQIFLGFIGGVALFISAIGITNTMIMSIYERTREIGVMKVIGATISDIRRMFLLEASLIGFFGGGIGLLLSYLISFLMNKFGAQFLQNMMMGGSTVSIIPLWLSGATLVFATVIGLVSGYLPARRATKLSPLVAIRTE